MANFLTQGDGQYVPWVRWGAKACQWEASTEDGKTNIDFTQAIIDLENIKVGWACIQTGQAPQWEFCPSLTQSIPRPEGVDDKGKPLWKRGFSVKVYSTAMFGDEPVREFATNQKGSLEAVSNLLEAYDREKGNNPGKVPVVEFKGHTYVGMGSNGTNVPRLEIVKWVDRPAALEGLEQQSSVEAAPTPPPAQAAAQPAQAAGAEF